METHQSPQFQTFLIFILSVFLLTDIGVDDSDVRYYEKELDEFHPRATRTLFVGNLDRTITREELKEAFQKFGDIVVSTAVRVKCLKTKSERLKPSSYFLRRRSEF